MMLQCILFCGEMRSKMVLKKLSNLLLLRWPRFSKRFSLQTKLVASFVAVIAVTGRTTTKFSTERCVKGNQFQGHIS